MESNTMLTTKIKPITEMQLTQIVVPDVNGQPFQTQICLTKQYLTQEVEIAPVYRVLRINENPQNGLTAKNPLSTVGAAYHVAWGSSISKYISTCSNLESAKRVAKIHYKNFNQICAIVRIDLHNWKKEQDAFTVREIFCVWDINVRNEIIRMENPDILTQERFHKFAAGFDEVLLVGYIPAKYIIQEYDITELTLL